MRETKQAIMQDAPGPVLKSKVVANNTIWYKRGDGAECYRLHHTNVVVRYPDGTIELDSGGWRTPTTKERINRYLPIGWCLWQRGGVWWLDTPNGVKRFRDGMLVREDGMEPHEVAATSVVETLKKAETKRRKLRQYAKGYIKALLDGKVPPPSNADCWYCVFHGMGDRDETHILSHVREHYYVPSLLTNAIRRFPVSRAAESVLAQVWGAYYERGEFEWMIASYQLERALTRYLYEQCGFAA